MPTTQMTQEEVQGLNQDIKTRLDAGEYAIAYTSPPPTLGKRLKHWLQPFLLFFGNPFLVMFFYFAIGVGLASTSTYQFGGIALLACTSLLMIHFSHMQFRDRKLQNLNLLLEYALAFLQDIRSYGMRAHGIFPCTGPCSPPPPTSPPTSVPPSSNDGWVAFAKHLRRLVGFLRREQSLVERAMEVRATLREVIKIPEIARLYTCLREELTFWGKDDLEEIGIQDDRDEIAKSNMDFLADFLADPYKAPQVKLAVLAESVHTLGTLGLPLHEGHDVGDHAFEADELDGMGDGDCGCGCEDCREEAHATGSALQA
ncbi:MAG: hypothetical protein H6727_09285 [Myxococcales bacterium]|nr:hypothetical protein [Myxococcales bacterium]